MTQLQIISSDIGFAAFGVGGRALIDVALLTSQVKPLFFFLTFTSYLFVPQIGFCCAYLIFISENLETYIPVS